MTRFQITALISATLWGLPVYAQDLPGQLLESLDQQGFEVVSKRTTWLGRTYVEASNGATERRILIARGSGQILQDNWINLPAADDNEARDSGDNDDAGTSDHDDEADTSDHQNDVEDPEERQNEEGSSGPPQRDGDGRRSDRPDDDRHRDSGPGGRN